MKNVIANITKKVSTIENWLNYGEQMTGYAYFMDIPGITKTVSTLLTKIENTLKSLEINENEIKILKNNLRSLQLIKQYNLR